MYKKKIKVLLSKLSLEVIRRDSLHFKVSREKLCNDILVNFSLKSLSGIEREMFDDKAYLQFTLNQCNCEYFDIISKNIMDESKFIKNIFSSYIHLNPFYREMAIFKDKLIIISTYIEKKTEVYVSINGNIEKIIFKGVKKCELTDYVKLLTTEGEFYLNDLRLIY